MLLDMRLPYFAAAGFADIHTEDKSPQPNHGLFGGSSDPLIGVWVYKPSVEG